MKQMMQQFFEFIRFVVSEKVEILVPVFLVFAENIIKKILIFKNINFVVNKLLWLTKNRTARCLGVDFR